MEDMDLVALVEGKRFLGSEFLLWVWFESEAYEGTLPLADGTQCEFWLESDLVLANGTEIAALKGMAPSANAEAHEALRQGKIPTRARIRILRNELEFGFVLSAEDLSLSSVKIPAQLKREQDEKFYERMFLIEQLEQIVESLFADFLVLRLSKTWETTVLPAIRTWVRDDPVDLDEYGRRRAEALARRHRPPS